MIDVDPSNNTFASTQGIIGAVSQNCSVNNCPATAVSVKFVYLRVRQYNTGGPNTLFLRTNLHDWVNRQISLTPAASWSTWINITDEKGISTGPWRLNDVHNIVCMVTGTNNAVTVPSVIYVAKIQIRVILT
jgi:hypothetical protein